MVSGTGTLADLLGSLGCIAGPPMSSKDQACCDITLSDWGLKKVSSASWVLCSLW